MSKVFFHLILLSSLVTTSLLADNDLIPYRINFLLENDTYNRTDEDYSSGESLSAIFYVDKPTSPLFTLLKNNNSTQTDTYFNFSITNQIYTPSNTKQTELIVDDHPYAGWTYIKMAIYQSSKTELNSLSLKIGIIGPSSGSEQIQYNVHKVIGSNKVMGWDNQLNDELGINLQYLYKRHYIINILTGIESSFTPFVEAQLGNISVNINSGLIIRYGWNIPKDFGFSNINIANEDGIPIYNQRKEVKRLPWSFNINFTASVTAVARDIFLDGNTFTDSHSVEKENFIGHIGYGFSTRYKNFVLEFLGVISTKKFKKANNYHAVGTTKISWLF